jgi:hypothetical protein
MKKTLTIAILQLGLIGFSHASYLESCNFTAKVTDILAVPTLNENTTYGPGDSSTFTHLVSFQILEATNAGSHVQDICQTYLGSDVLMVVDPMQIAIIPTGTLVKLSYFHASGISPDGPVASTHYHLEEVILEDLED